MLTYPWSPTLNTAYDICVERAADDTLRIYLGGSVVASGTLSATLHSSTADLTVGASLNSGTPANFFKGRMAGLPRITKAERYGGAYTPPTPPWPTS